MKLRTRRKLFTGARTRIYFYPINTIQYNIKSIFRHQFLIEMSGRKASWSRQFFCIDKSSFLDKVTKLFVESDCDRCIVKDDNGKECGISLKRCTKNGTTGLINHLKRAHGDNEEVIAAAKIKSGKVSIYFQLYFLSSLNITVTLRI